MTVETASYLSQLDATYPQSGDLKSEGDNHLRLIKSAVKATFPNLIAAPVTPSTTELNYITGVTSAIQTQLNAEATARAAADTAESNARIAADALKANLASPTFTGVVTVPTPSNTTDATNKTYVDALVSATAFSTALPAQTGNSGKFVTTNGTSASWATAATLAANTFTGTQTLSGSSSTFGAALLDTAETVNVVASAPSATTNLYVQSGSVQYYTTNAANNFVVNLAFSGGTSMNTALATGQSVTAALITTQSATAYYGTSIQVDGTTTGVTTKWIGGAPTAGNASGLDTYRFSIIKTASATFTVLASLTQYK